MKGLVLKVDLRTFEGIITDTINNLIIDKNILVFQKDNILIRETNDKELLTGRACIIDIEQIHKDGECIEIDQQLIMFKRNPIYHIGF